MAKGKDYPETEQDRFPNPMPDLGKTNAKPRCDEYDLHRQYMWSEEGNFKVSKRGNKVTKDGNY